MHRNDRGNDRKDDDSTDPTATDPTARGGPASPVIPGTGGAQAGGGPHVGATEGGTRGVLDLGRIPAGTPAAGGLGTPPDGPPDSPEDGPDDGGADGGGADGGGADGGGADGGGADGGDGGDGGGGA